MNRLTLFHLSFHTQNLPIIPQTKKPSLKRASRLQSLNQKLNSITVAYEVINMDIEKNICVLRAAATMKVGKDVRNAMSFGEASNENLMGGGKKFPVAMAEKRAMSRVVLKIAGFYEQGVFGQDEIVD